MFPCLWGRDIVLNITQIFLFRLLQPWLPPSTTTRMAAMTSVSFRMFVPSVLIHIPFYHSTEDQIGTVAMILVIVQCIVLIASIIPTEHALKKTFDRNGNRI